MFVTAGTDRRNPLLARARRRDIRRVLASGSVAIALLLGGAIAVTAQTATPVSDRQPAPTAETAAAPSVQPQRPASATVRANVRVIPLYNVPAEQLAARAR